MTKQQHRAAWVFGGILLFVIVAVVYVAIRPERRDLSYLLPGLLHFLIAMAGGLLAAFFIGTIEVKGEKAGFQIRAAGAFAVFVLLLFAWTPFGIPPTPPVFEGELLGDFIDLLQEAYAEGKTDERILLAATNAPRLSKFRLSVQKVTAENWIRVAQQICDLHTCLICRTQDSGKRVEIDFRNEPKECKLSDNDAYYLCDGSTCSSR